MNLLSYLSLFNVIGCSILIFITLGRNSGSPLIPLNKAFILALLAALPWPVADIFIPINTAPPVLWPLHYLKTIAWVLLPPAILNFVLEFTKHEMEKKKNIVPLIFLPAAFIYSLQWTVSPFIERFTVSGFGTADIPSFRSASFIILCIYVLAYIGFTLALLAIYTKRSESRRFRREAKLIAICIAAGYIATPLNNILHQFLYTKFPHSGPLGLFFVFLITMYLVQQHQTVIPDYSLFLNDIMNSVKELMLIVLPNQTIKHVNEKLLSVLDYTEEELVGKNLSEITNIKVNGTGKPEAAESDAAPMYFFRKEGQEVLADIQIYPVKDKYGESAGAVIIAHLLSDFEQAVHHYNISTQEREVIRLIIKGYINKEIADIMGIKAGTVKNYIYNIFRKTGVQNRIELVQLFNPV